MNNYAKQKKAIFCCFLFIFLISFIHANLDLTPQVELCKNGASECYNENTNKINEQDSLLLKITLANSDYEIVCLNEPKLTYFFYKDSIGQTTTQDMADSKEEITLPEILCIPKNEKMSYFQILEKYSSLEPKERKNKWIIEDVKLEFKTSTCYNVLNYYSKPTNQCFSSSNNYFTGDKEIEINVSGKASSIGWFSNLGNSWQIILGIIGAGFFGIAIGLWIAVIIQRKNKPLLWALCCSIIAIIIGLFGFNIF